jgi:hypothetical protein
MNSSPPTRNILVAGFDALMDEILQRLFQVETNWQVKSVSFEDEKTFVEDVSRLSPDVIVFNRESRINFADFFVVLSTVLDTRSLQMVVVGGDSNMIDIYEKQQFFKLNSRGLVDLIQSHRVEMEV